MDKYETNPEKMWYPSSREKCRSHLELINYLIDVYVADGLTSEQIIDFSNKYEEILELCKNPNNVWKKDALDYIKCNIIIIKKIIKILIINNE
jgi:hypothetical protein